MNWDGFWLCLALIAVYELFIAPMRYSGWFVSRRRRPTNEDALRDECDDIAAESRAQVVGHMRDK